MCWRGDGLSPWPVAFPQSPLQTSRLFYLAELSQSSVSSETGVNPGSGKAWKGVGGKCQGSVFSMQFISGPRVGAVPEKQGHGL